MININLEHKEFEDTLLKSGFPVHHLRKDRKGGYLRKNVESAFQGWILKVTQHSAASK